MAHPNHIGLRWLIGFRWGAAAGKLGVVLATWLGFAAPLPLGPVLGLIGLEAASNLLLIWVGRARPHLSPRLVLGLMAFDVLNLTALLHLTGGSSNPFSVVYLIYLALAAVSLPVRWSWGLGLLAALCFGSLFGAPADMHHGPQEMARHLHGMWVAFVIAAFFIVFFVNRLRRELATQQDQLARAQRLAAVTTLAAGAAHELSTPLGTIAVAANELRHALASGEKEAREDVELIRDQVERCRQILGNLRDQTATTSGETPRAIGLDQLLAPLRERHAALQVRIERTASGQMVLPVVALRQLLASLVDNAVDASEAAASIDLVARRMGERLLIAVSDRGVGMSEELSERARDPFFTTKEAGQGVGLGLFLADAVAEQLDGSLTIESKVGAGTTVTFEMPLLATQQGVSL